MTNSNDIAWEEFWNTACPDGNPGYPNGTVFVDIESSHARKSIWDALDEHKPVAAFHKSGTVILLKRRSGRLLDRLRGIVRVSCDVRCDDMLFTSISPTVVKRP